MARDELLRVSGSATGAPKNATLTATADLGGGYKYVGSNRTMGAVLTAGGAYDRTTGDETMDITVHAADDASGTNAVQIASFPQEGVYGGSGTTRGDSGYYSGTTARYSEVPSAEPRKITFTTPNGKPYVKVRATMAGTSPSAAEVVVDLVKPGLAARRSGI